MAGVGGITVTVQVGEVKAPEGMGSIHPTQTH